MTVMNYMNQNIDTRVFVGGVNDVYPNLIDSILVEGKMTYPRGKVCREINPAVLEIHNPELRLVSSHNRLVNVPFALAEVLWILGGREDVKMLSAYNGQISNYSDDGKRFNAAYGERIRWSYGHDQLMDMIACLQQDTDSRQAELVIAHPWYDRSFDWMDVNTQGPAHVVKDRACNVFSHAMIREGALVWTQILRSNDAIWGVPYNLMQWTHVMEYVAAHLGLPLGHYIMLSDSMHIYEEGESAGHLDEARSIRYFDIYRELGVGHAPMPVMSLATLKCVLGDEAQIRGCTSRDELLSLFKPMLDGYEEGQKWIVSVLCILAAYRLWRLMKDDPLISIDDVMTMLWQSGDPVYAAATAKFFYQKRWNRTNPVEARDEISGRFEQTVVIDWIIED